MVVESTYRMVSLSILANWRWPPFFGCLAGTGCDRVLAVDGAAVLRVALQSGHRTVAVSFSSDPRQSDSGCYRRAFSRLAAGAGNVALLDAAAYPWDEVAQLYGLRWDAEINLRSLKTMMNMDVLRCQTPEMVRKEIWAHLLAYNLIRIVIAQAAQTHGKHPRQISFTRALRTLEAFRQTLAHTQHDRLPGMYKQILKTIASHEIANRPNRLEPRNRKRRPKPYKLMTKPHNEAVRGWLPE